MIAFPEHPYLFLDRQGWESLADKLEDPFFASLHQRNVQHLQTLGPVDPPREGSRSLKSRLQRAIVAWYITGEAPYLQQALDALAVCWERPELWWVTDEHIGGLRAADLSTGEMLYNVALAYDALYPHLSEGQRAACERVLVDEGLAAYERGLALHDWWARCDFNWNSALHGNAGLAALALGAVDPELVARVLDEVIAGLPYMVRAFYPGGGYIEGVMYFHTALGHLTDFLAPYYRLTGDDLGLLDNADIADTITWKMHMWGGDDRPLNISDVNEFVAPLALAHIDWWARQLDRPDWAGDNDRRLAAARTPTGLFHDVEAFWYRQADQPTEAPDLGPPDSGRLHHWEALDWLTWHGEHTWLAFRAGWNGGNHDNDDLGHFILGIDDERHLCDPGYGATLASQHQCLTIRSQEQTDGATARTDLLEPLEGGFYLRCDIRQAFPHVLERYDRHLLLVNDRDLLLVDDVLGAVDPGSAGRQPEGYRLRTTVRSHLQTRLPVTKTDVGWRIHGENHVLRVIHLSPTGFYRLEEHRPARDGRTVRRILFREDYDRPHALMVTLLTFGDPEYTYVRDEAGLHLTLDGASYTLASDEEGRLRLVE
jgi:hypothetical protein